MDKVDKVESTIGKGVVAGFVATFALSVLLDPIALFAPTVWPTSTAVGWVLHFFVGTVIWGVAFAIVHDYLHGSSWQRGLAFALGAWVVVMGGAIALREAGVIAFALDVLTIVVTLIVHVLYGVMLGVVYGWLIEGTTDSPHEPHGEEPHPVAR
jgi:hypothetical protein